MLTKVNHIACDLYCTNKIFIPKFIDMKYKLLTIFLGLCTPFLLDAQDSLRWLGQTDGGASYSILHYNNYLYVGAANTFMVFDASGQPPYTETFRYRLTSMIDDIQRQGDTLYLCANHAGIYKWYITNLANPVLACRFKPADYALAAYDISFYGRDTLLVCMKSKVGVFRDHGDSLQLIHTFGQVSGLSKIRGGEVQDSIFAYVTMMGADSLFIHDVRTGQLYSRWKIPYCDPEDILFGQADGSMLHILGGTQSTTNGFDPSGCFYSIDISDPYNPVEIFRDTLKTIIGVAIAAAVNGVNRNDTIWVATTAAMDTGWVFPQPATGQVYLYDVSNKANIHFLGNVYGGLWHFDVDLQGNLLQVASEWYGVETIDVSDIFNEQIVGRTLTGGWNWGSGVKGDTLVVCNGGYGYKVFDISNPKAPVWIDTNLDGNFVKSAEFSEDGKYLFCWYFTGHGFRVHDAATYTEVATLAGSYGDKRTYVWNDLAISQTWGSIGSRKLHFIDVSNPLTPAVDTSFNYAANDYYVDKAGLMYVAHNDSLSVWDLANNLQSLASVKMGLFTDFKTLAVFDDTIWAYVTNKGLVRYLFDGLNTITEDTVVSLIYGTPDFMAADSFGLYLCYHEYGLFAFDKKRMAPVSFYEHTLEFVHTHVWGPQDLFCKNGLIYLVEWFGQTTILTNKNGILTGVNEYPETERNDLVIFPNPTGDFATVVFRHKEGSEYQITVSDLNGKIFRSYASLPGNMVVIDTKQFSSGIYMISVIAKEGIVQTARLVVE